MSRSAFYDLFDAEEAANLEMRAELMRELKRLLNERFKTQQAAAEHLGVEQSRISNLYTGKISLFSIDMLLSMITKLGKRVEVSIKEAA
ncbi:MAG: helix-turn-helix domain-containing protein [Thiolinea sp.]